MSIALDIKRSAENLRERWQRARDAETRAEQLRDDADKAQRVADAERAESERIKREIIGAIKTGKREGLEIMPTAKVLPGAPRLVGEGQHVPHWLVSVYGCVVAEIDRLCPVLPDDGPFDHPDDAAEAAREYAEPILTWWLESIGAA